MAKIHFSLVAPERELFAGEVDQVDAPGVEGDFGVLPGHEPFMTTLRAGIEGGFADVTPESFTLLAEHAAEA
jgi:F-type H+-transporting ATPase subunit epsilon